MGLDPRETEINGTYVAIKSDAGGVVGSGDDADSYTIVFRNPPNSNITVPTTATTTPTPITVPQQTAIKVYITPIAMYPKPTDVTPDTNWQRNSAGTSYTGTAWLSKSLWQDITPYLNAPNIHFGSGWSWDSQNCQIMVPDNTSMVYRTIDDTLLSTDPPFINTDPPLPFVWSDFDIPKIRLTIGGLYFLPTYGIYIHFVKNGVKYRFFSAPYFETADGYLESIPYNIEPGVMVPFRSGYAFTRDDPDRGRTGYYIFELTKEPFNTVHSWPDGYGGYNTDSAQYDDITINQDGLLVYLYDGDQGPYVEKLEIWNS